MASKSSGSFFRKFFKLIFSLAGLVVAVLAVIMMALPVSTVSVSVLGQTATGTVSGFAWAFGGDCLFTLNGEVVDNISQTVDPNAGMLATVLLLIIGAVLALIYVFFSWGHKNPSVKKGIGGVSALILLVGAILCFCATSLTGQETGNSSFGGLVDASSTLGIGAIMGGIFGIASALLMVIATLLGPKEN